MKIGDTVNMKSAVVQFGGAKVSGSMTVKAVPGRQMVFLYLGGMDMKNPGDFNGRAALAAMGWIPGPAFQAELDADAVVDAAEEIWKELKS